MRIILADLKAADGFVAKCVGLPSSRVRGIVGGLDCGVSRWQARGEVARMNRHVLAGAAG